MNTSDLLQALQYSIGKGGEEIKLAEKFLQEVPSSLFYSLIPSRPSPKMDICPIYWSSLAIKR